MLEQFQQRILRAILGVHWQDRITDARILEQADTTSIDAHIVRSQLSWAGHVRRMPETRVPKQLLYAELSSGKRKTGGQWKRYKDQLKVNLKKCEMDLQWETTADDRAYWRRASRMGVANHLERRRITTEAEKRERRKNREYDNDTSDSAVCVCNVCGRICRSAPTHSSNINLFILIIIIILDDSDHHTRSRGIARERERVNFNFFCPSGLLRVHLLPAFF